MEFIDNFFYKSLKISNLTEILPTGVELLCADRRTDGYDVPNRCFLPLSEREWKPSTLPAVHITYWSSGFSSSKIPPCCINCMKLFSSDTQFNRRTFPFPHLYLFLNPSLPTRRILIVRLRPQKLSLILPISFVSLLSLSAIHLLCLAVLLVWGRLMERMEL
jgi:hypothetical protein